MGLLLWEMRRIREVMSISVLQTSWNCKLLSIYHPGALNSILVSSPAELF